MIPKILFTSFKPPLHHDPICNSVINTWKNLNPTYHILYFSDAQLEEYFKHHRKSKEFFKLNSGVAKADFFRVCYIESHGGIWFDFDLTPISIDNYIDPKALVYPMIIFDSGFKNLSYMLIGGKGPHPIWNKVVETTAGNINRLTYKTPKSSILHVTGPRVLQTILSSQFKINCKDGFFPADKKLHNNLFYYFPVYNISRKTKTYTNLLKRYNMIGWHNDNTPIRK